MTELRVAGRPLRVLLARARSGESTLAARLRERAAWVCEAPRLEAIPAPDRAVLDRALIESTTWVFGCAASVETVLARAARLGAGPAPIAVVGEAAKTALLEAGKSADLALAGSSEPVLRAQADWWRGRRCRLFVPVQGRPDLAAALRALGAEVAEIPCYQIHATYPEIDPCELDLVLLASSTSAPLVYGHWGEALCALPAVVIGPKTAAAARQAGCRRIIAAAGATFDGMLRAAEEFCRAG